MSKHYMNLAKKTIKNNESFYVDKDSLYPTLSKHQSSQTFFDLFKFYKTKSFPEIANMLYKDISDYLVSDNKINENSVETLINIKTILSEYFNRLYCKMDVECYREIIYRAYRLFILIANRSKFV